MFGMLCTEIPGAFISTMKELMPLCFGTSGFVRASRIMRSATCPLEVQIFCPLIT
jgi:hypothetical protein